MGGCEVMSVSTSAVMRAMRSLQLGPGVRTLCAPRFDLLAIGGAGDQANFQGQGDLRGASLRTSSTKRMGKVRASKSVKSAGQPRLVNHGSADTAESKKMEWNASFISFLDDLECSQDHTKGTAPR